VGLKRLEGLTQLQKLNLWGTQITDSGLQHLKGLKQLRLLLLAGTKVTDEGVKELQQALPNCEIRH
jgi:internalin A